MGSEDDDWTWKFAPRAAKQFERLEHHVQDRILPKLRVGQYRLACVVSHDDHVLEVHRIEHRGGALDD